MICASFKHLLPESFAEWYTLNETRGVLLTDEPVTSWKCKQVKKQQFLSFLWHFEVFIYNVNDCSRSKKKLNWPILTYSFHIKSHPVSKISERVSSLKCNNYPNVMWKLKVIRNCYFYSPFCIFKPVWLSFFIFLYS